MVDSVVFLPDCIRRKWVCPGCSWSHITIGKKWYKQRCGRCGKLWCESSEELDWIAKTPEIS